MPFVKFRNGARGIDSRCWGRTNLRRGKLHEKSRRINLHYLTSECSGANDSPPVGKVLGMIG